MNDAKEGRKAGGRLGCVGNGDGDGDGNSNSNSMYSVER